MNIEVTGILTDEQREKLRKAKWSPEDYQRLHNAVDRETYNIAVRLGIVEPNNGGDRFK